MKLYVINIYLYLSNGYIKRYICILFCYNIFLNFDCLLDMYKYLKFKLMS